MFYAQINNDNVVIAMTETYGVINAPHMIEIQDMSIDLRGKIWNGTSFENPPPPPPPVYARYIDIGPFYDRFGTAKYAVLASTNANVQMVIKDIQIRKWVDLDSPQVAAGIDLIIAAGVPGVDAALKNAIINTPVTAEEQFALVKDYF